MMHKLFLVLRVCGAVPVIVALLILSIASASGFFGQANQIAELASHFRFLYALAFLPCLLLLLGLRFWKLSIFFFLFFIVNTIPVLEFYFPQPRVTQSNETLKVLQFNLWGPRNSHHDKVLNLVKEKSPDLIGFSEITDTWVKVLVAGLPEYKYQVIEKRFGGVAIFSKVPISKSQVHYFGSIKRPRIEAELLVNKSPVNIVFAHTVTPFQKYLIRNGELQEIANTAANSANSVIVFGDLNCSPWSYYFGRLLETGKLYDTAKGFGFRPTWTTHWFFPWMAIDHCLTSKDLSAIDRSVGPDVGSDHLPVYVELDLSKKTEVKKPIAKHSRFWQNTL